MVYKNITNVLSFLSYLICYNLLVGFSSYSSEIPIFTVQDHSHHDSVRDFDIDLEGQRIITSDTQGKFFVWDYNTSELMERIDLSSIQDIASYSRVNSIGFPRPSGPNIRFSVNENKFIIFGNNNIYVYDTLTDSLDTLCESEAEWNFYYTVSRDLNKAVLCREDTNISGNWIVSVVNLTTGEDIYAVSLDLRFDTRSMWGIRFYDDSNLFKVKNLLVDLNTLDAKDLLDFLPEDYAIFYGMINRPSAPDVLFTKDMKKLVIHYITSSNEHGVRIVDYENQNILGDIAISSISMFSSGGWIALSPDSQKILLSSTNESNVYNLNTGLIDKKLNLSMSGLTAFGIDNNTLLYPSAKLLNLVDIESGETIRSFPKLRLDTIKRAKFNKDGSKIVAISTFYSAVSSNYESYLSIHDIPSNQLVRYMHSSVSVNDLTELDDNNLLISTNSGLSIWNIPNNSYQNKAINNPLNRYYNVQLSPDQMTIIVVAESISLSGMFVQGLVVDSYEEAFRTRLMVSLPDTSNLDIVSRTFFDKKSEKISYSHGRHDPFRLADVNSGDVIHEFVHGGNLTSMSLSSDASLAATAGDDKLIKIWDAVSGDNIKTLTEFGGAHNGTIQSLLFGANQDYLISQGSDKTVKIWDIDSGQVIRRFDLCVTSKYFNVTSSKDVT